MEKADIEKIEKMNSDLNYVHKSFMSRDSRCYEHFKKVMDHAVAEKSLTRMNKELIAVGISAYAYCEPCLNWHIREALKDRSDGGSSYRSHRSRCRDGRRYGGGQGRHLCF